MRLPVLLFCALRLAAQDSAGAPEAASATTYLRVQNGRLEPAPAPRPELIVRESAARRFLVRHEPPAYPAVALAAGIQGTVRVGVIIDRSGEVVWLRILSGHPLLASAALHAVKAWQFDPGIFTTAAKFAGTEITLSFSLDPAVRNPGDTAR